jgi:hypothetical protein
MSRLTTMELTLIRNLWRSSCSSIERRVSLPKQDEVSDIFAEALKHLMIISCTPSPEPERTIDEMTLGEVRELARRQKVCILVF